MTTKTGYFKRPLALLVLALLAASVMMLARPAQAANFAVTNTNDAGAGSLRQAISDANTTLGADTINFELGSAATITLASQLPTITDSAGLTIDGGSTNITISGNKSVGVFAVGTGAKLTLSNLTVADGFAGGLGGGGIFNRSGTLEVNNSTLSGNSASSFGGGITAAEGTTLTVTNSTFSGNTARVSGGGITSEASTITIRNTILASSPCSTSDSGTFTDGGGNLDEGATCGFTASSSKSNTPAGLDPAGLQNNGGPTNTIALQASSAAIDAAVECPPPTTDQRGVERPQGEACDSGAFELVVELQEGPQTKAECKNGGYKEFGFKNQGQCIKAVNHAS
jgi:predicted outer membrane repeat protein